MKVQSGFGYKQNIPYIVYPVKQIQNCDHVNLKNRVYVVSVCDRGLKKVNFT